MLVTVAPLVILLLILFPIYLTHVCDDSSTNTSADTNITSIPTADTSNITSTNTSTPATQIWAWAVRDNRIDDSDQLC